MGSAVIIVFKGSFYFVIHALGEIASASARAFRICYAWIEVLIFAVQAATSRASTMRLACPRCAHVFKQTVNKDGPNFCPKCKELFTVPTERPVPPWIVGVLVVFAAYCQVMFWLRLFA